MNRFKVTIWYANRKISREEDKEHYLVACGLFSSLTWIKQHGQKKKKKKTKQC